MWLLAGVFSCPHGPLHRAACVLKTWQLTSPRVRRERVGGGGVQNRSHSAFQNLILEVTDHHFCLFYGSHRPTLLQRGRTLHKSVDIRRGLSLEAILEAGYHVGCWSGRISFKSLSCWLRCFDISCFYCLSSWEIWRWKPRAVRLCVCASP